MAATIGAPSSSATAKRKASTSMAVCGAGEPESVGGHDVASQRQRARTYTNRRSAAHTFAVAGSASSAKFAKARACASRPSDVARMAMARRALPRRSRGGLGVRRARGAAAAADGSAVAPPTVRAARLAAAGRGAAAAPAAVGGGVDAERPADDGARRRKRPGRGPRPDLRRLGAERQRQQGPAASARRSWLQRPAAMPPTAARQRRGPQLAARVRLLAAKRRAAAAEARARGRRVRASPAAAGASAPAAGRRLRRRRVVEVPARPARRLQSRERQARGLAQRATAPARAGAAAGGFVSAARVADRQSRSGARLTATLSTAAGDERRVEAAERRLGGGMCEPSDVHLSDASVLHFSRST